MQKIFKIQKITSIVFILTALVVSFYALYFMTDYQDLFGFVRPVNLPIAEFYGRMQDFNQTIFWGAVIQVALFVLALILETGKRVPDLIALILILPLLAVVVGFSVYGILGIPPLRGEYAGLDFSNIYLEAGPKDYELKFFTFDIAPVVYILNIVVTVFYGFILVKSHQTFVKSSREEARAKQK